MIQLIALSAHDGGKGIQLYPLFQVRHKVNFRVSLKKTFGRKNIHATHIQNQQLLLFDEKRTSLRYKTSDLSDTSYLSSSGKSSSNCEIKITNTYRLVPVRKDEKRQLFSTIIQHYLLTTLCYLVPLFNADGTGDLDTNQCRALGNGGAGGGEGEKISRCIGSEKVKSSAMC